MRDGDAWLANLATLDELLAVRVMEVRLAYMQSDFEWENLQAVTVKDTQAANIRLMRAHASERFGGLMAAAEGPEGEEH